MCGEDKGFQCRIINIRYMFDSVVCNSSSKHLRKQWGWPGMDNDHWHQRSKGEEEEGREVVGIQ